MHRILILLSFWTATALVDPRTVLAAEVISAERIWESEDQQVFFTDLIRFRGQWICCFREAASHGSEDGQLLVIRSSNGTDWRLLAKIHSPPPNRDLRDPKLSITPRGRLMLTATAYQPQPKCRSYVWFSADASQWSGPTPIGPPGEWLWRTEWHRGCAYNFGRSEKPHKYLQLYRSSNGKDFQPHGPRQFDGIYVNETAPLFLPDGTCLVLLRRDSESNAAQLGKSRPPYKEWAWQDLGVRIGGPEMILLPDRRLLATVRLYDGEQRTSLCWVDPVAGTLREFQRLPSGGDTSYAGSVWHGGLTMVVFGLGTATTHRIVARAVFIWPKYGCSRPSSLAISSEPHWWVQAPTLRF